MIEYNNTIPVQRRPTIPARQGGFTLVEAVVSIAVVALILVPAVQMISTAAKARTVQVSRQQGEQLAKELLSEIMQCPYVDPVAPETGQPRSTWNEVSVYNGLSESPPATRSGVALSGFTGWQRTVLVEWVNPASPGGSAAVSDLGLKRITVTVTSPAGKVTKLVGLRSSIGLADRKAAASATFTSWVDVTLDGGGSAKCASGVNLVNQVP